MPMKRYDIIPAPSTVRYGEGKSVFSAVVVERDGFEERYFAQTLAPGNVRVVRAGEESGQTLFVAAREDLSMPEEAYSLAVKGGRAEIVFGKRGLLYAYVTLSQILAQSDGAVTDTEIEDRPYCGYRGLMLDSARYFIPADDVRKIADLCVMHKLNAIHMHLTDDQGWRLESDAYPRLHRVGSRRSHTNFGCRPHEGYYTKAEMRSILRYCAERNIEVVPEIDMPGHMRAALAAYPELGCFGRKLPVATHSGVKHDILCAGKDEVYSFVFRVLDEVAELFRGYTRYIHIGGDEAPKMRWDICPACRRKAKEEGLKDSEQLQGFFMKKVAEHVCGLGFAPVVWNEKCMEGFMPEQTVWQYWHTDGGMDEKGTAATAAEGGGMINSDSAYAYVDLPYGTISLEKSYKFTPKLPGMPEEKALGGELELWGEYIPDYKTLLKRCLPRSCALAERMWSGTDGDYAGFAKRSVAFVSYLSSKGYDGEKRKAVYDPSALRGSLQKLWFERRQLHWEGLHNLIDDAKVKKQHGTEGSAAGD